jgi:hypothetical protein
VTVTWARRIAAGLLIAAWLVLGAVLVGWHAFDDDEFQHAHLAWAIAHGQVPYRDVFEHHLVLYHVLIGPVAAWCGNPAAVFVLRAVSWLCGGIAGLFAVRVARRYGVDPLITGLVAVVMAAVPMIGFKLAEARPAVPALLCCAFAIDYATRAAINWRRAAVLGAVLGTAILLSQKMVYLAIALGAGVTLTGGLAAAIACLLSAMTVGGLYLAAMAGWGCLAPFWEFAVMMNLHWKRSFSASLYVNEWFRSAPLLLAAAIPGLAHLHWRRDAVLVSAVVGGAAMVVLVPVPFRQAFLPLAWVVVVCAAIAIAQSQALWRSPAVAATAVLAACAALGLQHQAQWQTNASDRAQLAAITERFPVGPVFDGRGLVWNREALGFYPIMHEGIALMLDADRYAAATIAELEAAWPPVIADYRVAKMPAAVQSFLADRYRVDGAIDGLLVPGVVVPRSQLRRGTVVTIPVAGAWRIEWTGGPLLVDDEVVRESSVVALTVGEHRIRAQGFVRDVVLRLEHIDAP